MPWKSGRGVSQITDRFVELWIQATFLNSIKLPRFTGSVISEKYRSVKLISFCNLSSPIWSWIAWNHSNRCNWMSHIYEATHFRRIFLAAFECNKPIFRKHVVVLRQYWNKCLREQTPESGLLWEKKLRIPRCSWLSASCSTIFDRSDPPTTATGTRSLTFIINSRMSSWIFWNTANFNLGLLNAHSLRHQLLATPLSLKATFQA